MNPRPTNPREKLLPKLKNGSKGNIFLINVFADGSGVGIWDDLGSGIVTFRQFQYYYVFRPDPTPTQPKLHKVGTRYIANTLLLGVSMG